MYNPRPFHRRIALVLLAIFIPSLLPVNLLYANNSGPTSPEAATFESVDATDMVSLATGDMSYVLPLLNVPSPEGGYPLSLSYRSSIAVDQTESWVGTGWNLNVGAISRYVNQVPDDWEKTRVTELLYDKGETLNQYDFSIGGTLSGGVTLGFSKSWGYNKAWGGIVGYGGATTIFGSDNFGMVANFGGLSFSFDELNGKSIGVSGRLGEDGNSGSLGFGYNLDANVGSVGYGISGVGISLDTKGGGAFSFLGAQLSGLSTTAAEGDYFSSVSTKGFALNLSNYFWFNYKHTRFTYSLFLLNKNFVSGILNTYDTKEEENYHQKTNSYMDVNRFFYTSIYSRGAGPYRSDGMEVILPAYDNYVVSAQGLTGSFSPKIFQEINLYAKGSQNVIGAYDPNNPTKTDYLYFTEPSSLIDNTFKVNNKIYFYFDNVNSSFLRVKKGGFISQNSNFIIDYSNNINNGTYTSQVAADEKRLFDSVVTESDNTFNSTLSNDGHLIRNGYRKRDGNYIEAFTNGDILEGNVNDSFIESNGFDRANAVDLAESGIGAYQITTLDGKVYHYSLPVYVFEEVYKNFSELSDENEKFLETVKDKPYASHWLLTAITGPDYIDMNNNHKPDEGDYGYWVSFDYGKWSEAFAWRSPKTGFKEIDGKYFYSWGRKEVYYLDKIATRTHTALFVKGINGETQKSSSSKIQKGARDTNGNFISYSSGPMLRYLTEMYKDRVSRDVEQTTYYTEYPENVFTGPYQLSYQASGKHEHYKHIDLPVNRTLKLQKIVLLQNKDLNTLGAISTSTPADINIETTGTVHFDFGWVNSYRNRHNPYNIKRPKGNLTKNVFDVFDFQYYDNLLQLEEKAVKVIDFQFSNSGGVNLEKVFVNGKGNRSVAPPYEFKYYSTKSNSDEMDNWGYYKLNPEYRSLKTIINPLGASLDFEYESDSFLYEAVKKSDFSFKVSEAFNIADGSSGILSSYFMNGNLVVNLNTSYNQVNNDAGMLTYFYPNREINVNFMEKYNEDNVITSNSNSIIDNFIKFKVLSYDTSTKSIVMELLDENKASFIEGFYELPICNHCDDYYNRFCGTYPLGMGNRCKYRVKLEVNQYGNLVTYGSNGKKGGGLRVRRVTLKESNDNGILSNEIVYNYEDPSQGFISGVTSFEPTDDDLSDSYYYRGINEVPPPNVMYKYVTVTSKSSLGEVRSKQVYKFKVLDQMWFDDELNTNENFGYVSSGALSFKGELFKSKNNFFNKINIVDKLSSLGQILELTSYNSEGHIFGKVEYEYNSLDDNSLDNGTNQETFKYVRRVMGYVNQTDINGYSTWVQKPYYHLYSTSKVNMATFLKSAKYSSGGFSKLVFYDKYDFLTGEPSQVKEENSDGKIFKTKIVPAYLKYPEMGSKVDNIDNRNMLSQTTASYSYILDSGIWKETGVGITTWNNEWSYQDVGGNVSSPSNPKEKIWRKHKTYVWNGVTDTEGIFQGYDSSTDDGFVWGVGQSQVNSKWKQVSETTLYNHFSMPLEIKDINGNKASTKMDVFDEKVQATGNAAYNEMYYSGAEEMIHNFYVGKEIRVANAGRVTTQAHTGKYSIAATSDSQFGVFMRNGHGPGKYKISVWVHKDNASKARLRWFNNDVVNTFDFNGESYGAGDWVLKTHYTDVHFMNNSNAYWYVNSIDNTTVYFDDLMIRPIASSITGYVYNEYDELTHIIGNNGLATRYEYDAAGRLIKTYVEVVDDPANGVLGGFKLKSENKYHYKNL